MEPEDLLTASLVVVSVVTLALAVACAMRNACRVVAARRREQLLTIIRPRVLAQLAQGELDLAPLLGRATRSARSERRATDALVCALLSKLRGEDRAVLVRHLERSGALEQARGNTCARSRVTRARAAELLGAAAWRHGFPELVWLLRDPDRDVRRAAASALGRMGAPAAIEYLLRTLSLPRRSISPGVVSIALLHLGPESSAALTEALGGPSAVARALVAETLGLMGAVSAIEPLCSRLTGDENTGPRIAAAHALGRLAAPGAVGPLLLALKDDSSPPLRIAAVRALGSIGDGAAAHGLLVALRDPNHRVAREAARSLGALGDDGRRLLETTASRAGSARPHALEALDLWRNRRHGAHQ